MNLNSVRNLMGVWKLIDCIQQVFLSGDRVAAVFCVLRLCYIGWQRPCRFLLLVFTYCEQK